MAFLLAILKQIACLRQPHKNLLRFYRQFDPLFIVTFVSGLLKEGKSVFEMQWIVLPLCRLRIHCQIRPLKVFSLKSTKLWYCVCTEEN